MATQQTPPTPAQQVRAEFTEARRITRVWWSEREVLQALDRAETVALLALGIKPAPAQPEPAR
ncbi:MAG: hypothetical protein Q7U52_11830 [Hydrogenophaga sp.]|nr:hypothetical protein [Hydrogenophaga sp.]